MNQHTATRLLLIEGVPGIGKSTLVDRLLRHYVANEASGRLRTLVSLAQTHTYGPLVQREDAGTLTARENLAHLESIAATVEWLERTGRDQPRPKTFVTVDTLHLTHCLRPGVLQWSDVADIDRRLANAGCKLLLLDAADETVRARTVLARAETEFIRGYALGRFGDSGEALVAHFCRERDRFREMFSLSVMVKLRLQAERSAAELTDAGARFWLR
jgi:hypothetical protein